MMKKVLKTLGCLVLLGIIVAGGLWWYSQTSNLWNAKSIGDISAPLGYTRVEAPKGSYTEWLRELPLKKKGEQGEAVHRWQRSFSMAVCCCD